MPGPTPKPPHLRQRRNRKSTRATLPAESETKRAKIPPLPKRGRGMGAWHARVRAWWTAVWRSPMATEYLAADRHRLELIAELHQLFWKAIERGDSVTKLATEIRQQEMAFGLTPVDRNRLQWEVSRGEEAEEQRTQRKRAKQTQGKDPREILKAV